MVEMAHNQTHDQRAAGGAQREIDAGDFVEWKDPFKDDVEFRRVISILKIESTLEVERERSKYMLQLEPKEFGCRTDFIYSNEIIAHYKKVEKSVLKAN